VLLYLQDWVIVQRVQVRCASKQLRTIDAAELCALARKRNVPGTARETDTRADL
jgi:hypothetical protein